MGLLDLVGEVEEGRSTQEGRLGSCDSGADEAEFVIGHLLEKKKNLAKQQGVEEPHRLQGWVEGLAPPAGAGRRN